MDDLSRLEKWLKEEGRVLVAFSGGVDSTLLLEVAHRALGNDVTAVTGDSDSVPARDRKYVVEFCLERGIAHKFVKTDEFSDENYLTNPENRCYYCKRELFRKIRALADEYGLGTVLDGTNSSDLGGHRPGYRAIKEIEGVSAPYVELGVTKESIRKMADGLGLDVADKPASACLASRIPFGKVIDRSDLQRVDIGEEFLRDIGFTQVRLRHHGEIARIEFIKDELPLALEIRKKIVDGIKNVGYKYVTIDLRCYGEK